ncbi:GDSL esterase/lipase At2g04570-like [Rhodamnia argentea]|uniref:GDSL esterase/lipase At2g04570-like n=1 Tax=Rhodamnia argentea TaxID=178133 RepID=A0A8B8PZS9_9MYRT|nr:GDSL esterase/lipase At2g04570-like [Rhodamnia argentea]
MAAHVHLLLLLIATVCEAKVPAVIVFGDSSVDAGNNNVISTVLKSNFLPYGRDFVGGRPTGRFSNGRIPPDFISEAFGLKPTVPAYLDRMYSIKDFATGVCFASAGTGYDNATATVLNVIPMWREMEYYKEYQQKLRSYLGDNKANFTLSEALYLVSLGTNDFLENYYSSLPGGRRSQFTVGQYEDFLVGLATNLITELHRLGARKVSLTGLPPMGCLPLERTTNFFGLNECVQEYNDVAVEFNGKLRKAVARMNQRLPGLRMVLSDPYELFLQIIKKPSSFGFDITQRACCSTGLYEMSYLCNQQNPFTCIDASKYVFWDSFHPTEKMNQILSEYLTRELLLPTFS